MKTKTESRETRIIRHGRNLLAIFPNATEQDPGTLCRKLRRLEAKAAAIALRLCNGPEFEGGYDEVDRLTDSILVQVTTLLGNHEPNDQLHEPIVPIFINRDPRGCALKIRETWMNEHNPKLEKDWGGYGLIAPEIK